MRYLNQRYTMPYKECKGILTDVGTEALLWVRMGLCFLRRLALHKNPFAGQSV